MLKKVIVYIFQLTDSNDITMDDCLTWSRIVGEHLPELEYVFLPTIQSLFPKLSDPMFHVDYINIDVELLENYEIANPVSLIGTIKTLSNCTLYRNSVGQTSIRKTKIIGVVGENSSVAIIKEISSLVDGLCMKMGKTWTIQMCLEDQKKLYNDDLSIPKPIQRLLKNKKQKNKDSEIKLTPRQKQVYNMVSKRGATNKIIAKTLNISESTVKLHMGAILRKYGLKNRTQLAVFSKGLEV